MLKTLTDNAHPSKFALIISTRLRKPRYACHYLHLQSILQETEEEIESRCRPFVPLFSQLVTLIAGRVRYNDFEAFDKLQKDEQGEFESREPMFLTPC